MRAYRLNGVEYADYDDMVDAYAGEGVLEKRGADGEFRPVEDSDDETTLHGHFLTPEETLEEVKNFIRGEPSIFCGSPE